MTDTTEVKYESDYPVWMEDIQIMVIKSFKQTLCSLSSRKNFREFLIKLEIVLNKWMFYQFYHPNMLSDINDTFIRTDNKDLFDFHMDFSFRLSFAWEQYLAVNKDNIDHTKTFQQILINIISNYQDTFTDDENSYSSYPSEIRSSLNIVPNIVGVFFNTNFPYVSITLLYYFKDDVQEIYHPILDKLDRLETNKS